MYYKSEYRDDISNSGMFYSELSDYDCDNDEEKLILESDVMRVINTIESNVGEIIDMLENIKGLSEIDEAKEKLKELSEKLY